MSTVQDIRTSAATGTEVTPKWFRPPERTFRCKVFICPETAHDGSGFSVFVAKLPGAASQGETVEEALANITEACEGVLESYMQDAGQVPWEDVDTSDLPPDTIERWIVVHV